MDRDLLHARIAALDAAARSLSARGTTHSGVLDRAVVFEEWLLRGDIAADDDEEEQWPSFAGTTGIEP